MQHSGRRFLGAVILMAISYKAPTVWLAISLGSLIMYAVALVVVPFIIAASQNPNFTRVANRASAVLGDVAVAVLISVPVVVLYGYGLAK